VKEYLIFGNKKNDLSKHGKVFLFFFLYKYNYVELTNRKKDILMINLIKFTYNKRKDN